ncbi:MAG: class E sortase [Candidatus Saccharibacteria bacterium]
MDTDSKNPQPNNPADSSRDAANLIRQKVAQIYADEPNASREAAEAQSTTVRSKHQQFMYDLGTSGKDLATIQTEWHNYYIDLPSAEKHQVWREFYESSTTIDAPAVTETPINTSAALALAKHKNRVITTGHIKSAARINKRPRRDLRKPAEMRSAIRDTVSGGGKLTAKHHLQSLFFGLGIGSLVLVVFLFSFFNEVIIAPFIQPSRVASATPIIVDTNTVAPSATPEVIIPKINVEIPVNYDQTSTSEASIETALEDGIVHYPTTVKPGEQGNAAFFGHSSNNIFNKGKYKFAFVLLHSLVPGDTFYLTSNSKVYVYKVISKTIVPPTEVGVLGPVPGQTATATLITCDPPGTSANRLIVVGQQISPDPASNVAVAPTSTPVATTAALPGNGPTLFGRFMSTAIGKFIGIVFIVIAFVMTVRWVTKPKRQNR